ncbi:MAG TPA: hypothetical protein VL127_07605 [Bryobacteraceae bacterium]|nr:hypothetical protein [Bryobacteraceae bacterium]
MIAPLPLKDRFERHSFWLIFAVSSLIRIVKVLAAPRPPGTHLSEMENIARSLAVHGIFADPYLLPTGPTAHTAPGYPLVLGLIFLLFGVGAAGETVSRMASAIVASIQYALLPRVSTALGLPRFTGAVAGLLAALAPYKGYVEGSRDSVDQPYVALALVLLFLYTWKAWSSPVEAISPLARGLWWGLASLFSPILGFVFAAVIGYEFFALRRHAGLVPLVAAFAAIQAPWAIRNWMEFHAFVPTRSNFGLELRVSNRPESFALMEDNVSHGVMRRFHPGLNEEEARKVAAEGEMAYTRSAMADARAEIRRDPARFLRLTGERFWRFWLAPSRRFKTTAASTAITLLGLLGLCLLPANSGTRLTWLILLTYPLVYYFIQVDARYTYPLGWIFLTPAVYAVMLAAQRLAPSAMPEGHPS